MRGRARCCIICAFAFAFIIQLAIVFLYFPSSSLHSGLLDESAFPASPALRASPNTRSASNSSATKAFQNGPYSKVAPVYMQMVSPETAPIHAAQVQSIPSAVVSTAASKPALASSDLDPKHDLVQCLVSRLRRFVPMS